MAQWWICSNVDIHIKCILKRETCSQFFRRINRTFVHILNICYMYKYIYSSSKFYFIFVAFDERRRCIKWKIVMRRVFTLHTQAIQINQSNNTKHTFELEWPGMCVSFFRQLLTYPEEENHKFSTFCHFTVFIFRLILLMNTFFFTSIF